MLRINFLAGFLSRLAALLHEITETFAFAVHRLTDVDLLRLAPIQALPFLGNVATLYCS